LDGVESFGNDELRWRRKEVVDKVEKALEELEREVEGRWRAKTSKESKVTETQAPPTDGAGCAGCESTSSELTTPQSDSSPLDTQTTDPITGDTEPPIPEVPAPEIKQESSDNLHSPVSTSPTTSNNIATATETLADGAITIDTQEFVGHPHEEAENMSPGAIQLPEISSLATSAVTIKPHSVPPIDTETVDTFLLPASLDTTSIQVKRSPNGEVDGDAGSDWSEVEA